MKKQLFLTLLLSSVVAQATFDADFETPKLIRTRITPHADSNSPQNMFIPIPVIIGGAAILVAKKGIYIAKGLMRNPFVAGGIGTLIVAPTLKRTIFAEHPENNVGAVASSIKQEWQTDFAQAQANLEKAREDFKTNHPIAYKKLKKMYDAPQMQKFMHAASQGVDDFNQWCAEQKEIIIGWFDEEDNQPEPQENNQAPATAADASNAQTVNQQTENSQANQ